MLLERAIVVGVCALGIMAAACEGAPVPRPRKEMEASESRSENFGTDKDCRSDDFTKPDLADLTPCENGRGHCFDRAKAPFAERLLECDDADQVCVPNEILRAGGRRLKTCNATAGGVAIGAGACLTTDLVPEIAKQGGENSLERDNCDNGQLCVPCLDPTNRQVSTPFCQPIGVHENACKATDTARSDDASDTEESKGGSKKKACCTTNGKSNGACVSESELFEDQLAGAKRDTCASGDKCIPAPSGSPTACRDSADAPGVCLDGCFAGLIGDEVDEAEARGDCGATEVCVPCSSLDPDMPGCS
jgi:hypothetical protein